MLSLTGVMTMAIIEIIQEIVMIMRVVTKANVVTAIGIIEFL